MHLLHSSIAHLSIVHLQQFPILVSSYGANNKRTETKVVVMSVLTLNRPHGLPSLTGWFKAVQARADRYRRFRRTLNELSDLSNRDLADLGLTRSMLKRVAYQAACEAS